MEPGSPALKMGSLASEPRPGGWGGRAGGGGAGCSKYMYVSIPVYMCIKLYKTHYNADRMKYPFSNCIS